MSEQPEVEPVLHPRIGVMGGTFDPIHHGHLVAASEVASRFRLDEVIFVPTGQPWQKDKDEVTPAEHRYLMAVIATAANPRFSVSRVDIDRPGPTYTVDTLRDLRAAAPDAEWFFITGADALAAIMSWKNVDELFELAHFIGVTRPGYTLPMLNLPPGTVTLLEVPALAISSTDCRDRVRAAIPVWYLVPDGVVQYIAKHGLYRRDTDGPGLAGFVDSRPRELADREGADREPDERVIDDPELTDAVLTDAVGDRDGRHLAAAATLSAVNREDPQ